MLNLVLEPSAIADLVYVVLIVSMWVAVTAAYVPGTFILEVVGIIGLVGTFVVLTDMPTQWFAVLVVILGAAVFMVVPYLDLRYAPYALVGLVLQGMGSLFIFNDGVAVSLPVIVMTVLVPFAYHQFVLMPIIQRIKGQPIADKDALLIGMQGRVIDPIDPLGAVLVNSETWTATSDDRLELGDLVVVIARNGLQLVVEGVKRKRTPESDFESEENS